MFYKISCIIILIHFLIIHFANSQNEYSIYYQEATEENTFTQIVVEKNLQFNKYVEKKTIFKPNQTYWIKIKFNEQVNLTDAILLLNTPISEINCFSYDKNNVLKYIESGFNSIYKRQILQTGDKNKIFLNFQMKDNIVYLKIRNELLFKYNLDNMEVKHMNEWVSSNEKQHLFQGFFIGIIIILVLIGLLYKISTNRHINYYYIGYMISNLVLFLFLNEYTVEYIFFSQPRFDLCLLVSMHFASYFFIQFARSFFQLKQNLPKFDAFAKMYAKICLILCFCFITIAYFDFAIYSYVSIILEISNQLIGLLIVFFSFRKTDLIGKLIIIGSYFSTFDVIYMLYNNHIVEFTTNNMNIYQTGYIIEVIFIIIALKVKYSHVEKEQQETLIKNAVLESDIKIKEKENLLLKKENDITQLNFQLLQREIKTLDNELAINTMQLTQKDLLLSDLYEKIKKIQPETTGLQKKELNEILQNLNVRQKDTFWNEFEIYFEQIHNGFFTKLSETYPTLTQSEKRLCAFLKVGMTSKEIGNFTQKSYKSIEVFRSRLRKKIEIKPELNLARFLNSL
jgi:hypothetical protein